MAEKKTIQVKVITPERTVFEGEMYQATLPVSDGLVTILPNHRSYIASLKPGEVIIKKTPKDEEETDLYVSGGFIEFCDNNLVVLSDEAERAEEIDLKEAQAARERAEEIKSQKMIDEGEYARVVASIEKQLARIKIARKSYTRRGMRIN